MVPTSSSYICKVFDIIHMLWMGGSDLHHAVSTIFVVPSFWIWMKSCVTALHQMKSWCIDSGSRLTWNGHHILFIHTRCLTSFICCVDKKIGRTSIMLLPQNLLSHVFEFGWNPRSFLASNELIIQWLRLQTHMEWSPHPLHTYTRCLSSFKSCGWEDWISIMLLLQSLLSQVFEFGKNTGWKPCAKWSHDAMTEAKDSHGMVPTSSSYICKVLDIIHMLWMGDLDHHNAITTEIVVLCLWNWLKSCVADLRQMKSWCNDLGSRLTWNGPHILFIHMHGVWHHSYAVVGNIGPPSCCYHRNRTFSSVFLNLAEIVGDCLVPNQVMMQWLRHQTFMEWSRHPLHTYARCLTSFICFGCKDWTSIMLLPQILLSLVFEFGWNPVWLPCTKWSHDALIQAPDSHGMVTTSSSYICKVFDIIHMLCG